MVNYSVNREATIYKEEKIVPLVNVLGKEDWYIQRLKLDYFLR